MLGSLCCAPLLLKQGASIAQQSRNKTSLIMFQGEDDGTSLVPVEQYLAVRQGEKPLGVYALYDSGRNLQYVGYARNMTLAIKVPQLPALHAPWHAESHQSAWGADLMYFTTCLCT